VINREVELIIDTWLWGNKLDYAGFNIYYTEKRRKILIYRTLVRYPLSSINLSASTSSTSYFIKDIPVPMGRV